MSEIRYYPDYINKCGKHGALYRLADKSYRCGFTQQYLNGRNGVKYVQKPDYSYFSTYIFEACPLGYFGGVTLPRSYLCNEEGKTYIYDSLDYYTSKGQNGDNTAYCPGVQQNLRTVFRFGSYYSWWSCNIRFDTVYEPNGCITGTWSDTPHTSAVDVLNDAERSRYGVACSS